MRKNLLQRATLSTEAVPAPRCDDGSVLLANRYSLISAGTETTAVRSNVRDMILKAATTPEIRDQVKDMMFSDGVRKTMDRVRFETSKWTPLGYSGAGVAIEVGRHVSGIRVGDLVAYGGQSHAEFIRAPRNLCVKVPEGLSAREACFVAVGSIALQSVRKAQVQVGETVAVIGLGLVGQLVSQIARVSGARVIGGDLLPRRLELARSLGMEQAFEAGPQLPKTILRYTENIGVDRVMICASSGTSGVIDQAVEMARERGRIVVVGAVNMDVAHLPFYHKELELMISRSYGPGRYDPSYEEHGHDYPLPYVRWTEKRNMEEFLRLVRSGQVNVADLITGEYDLDHADQAYEALIDRPNETIGIVLRYDEHVEAPVRRVAIRETVQLTPRSTRPGIAAFGCGSFARQFHLPNLQKSSEVTFRALVTSSGQSAKEIGTVYGAEYCSTDWREVLRDPTVDAVMVLTRDRAHAAMTAAALDAGKHVFCEKPLATSYEECRQIMRAVEGRSQLCTVGFNRRFAPLVVRAKEALRGRTKPALVTYRVNAGPLPRNYWVYDAAYGAGRIVGEVCHFIDLVYDLLGSEPVSVKAHAVGDSASATGAENVTATFGFADGSVATVIYTALGHTGAGKERLEVFADGKVVVLDDYKSLSIVGPGPRVDVNNSSRDKGHNAEFQHFARALRGEEPLRITALDGVRAAVCCLKVLDSLKSGEEVAIDVQDVLAEPEAAVQLSV
jgi:predicted dehydrogenase/threonine dehydrogenase-like Zn-dependent dehydrogenase